VWILGGASVAMLGMSAFFYGEALGEYNHLQSSCKPTCSDAQTQSLRTEAALSYVTLGTGLAGLAGAVVWALLEPRSSAEHRAAEVRAPHVDIQPVPGGAVTTVGIAY
jgi:hypothetical protein